MRFATWAGVATAVVLGCGGASRSGVRQVAGALSVEPAVVDFGDVALGKEDRRILTVRNDGLVSMAVEQLPGSFADGAFDVVGLPANVPPGGSVEVRVTYHPQQTGSHARQIALMTDSPDAKPAPVGLRGHAVLGLAQLSVDVLDFGPVVVGERSTQSIALLNNDGKATTEIAVAAPQGDGAAAFSCSPQGKTSLAAEQSIKVSVSFVPPRLGEFAAVVPVTPCPTCSPKKVTLVGSGVERLVEVQPVAIDFGEVRLGTSASKPFSVTNKSKSPLTVTAFNVIGAAMTGAFGAAPQTTIQPGQTITGIVRFSPVELGQQNGQASIAVSDGAPGLVALTGLGMGAVIDTLPHDAYLGAVALGTTRSLRLRIFNIGLDPHATTPLVISGVTAQSADAGWSVAGPAASWTVGEPGATSYVDVSFAPRAEGLSNAKIVFQSNDALHPAYSVALSALARKLQPCKLSVAPGTLADFGDVAVNQPSTQGFELTNAGADDCVVGEPSFSTGFPTFHFPGDVTPSGRTLPPGGRMSLRIEFTPQREQSYSGGVDFYVSNPAAPTMHLSLKGNGDAGCFFVAPGAVDFGGAQSGCSAPQQRAYAVNHCAGTVTVTSVQTSGAPFSIGANAPAVPFQVASNTSVAIPIDYRAASPGDDVGQLIVSSDVRPGARYKIGLTGGSQANQSVNDSWDQSTPKVDLLLVLDNSGSMDDEQAALQQNLPRLWNRIALAKADYHLAVTTTGMSPYTQGWTQCPGGASGGEAGRFFPVDGSRPRILTPQTPNVRDVLFANTNVGLCHWDERGTEPLIAALTDPLVNATKAPGTPFPADGNAGFLRADARLAVLTISDANDYDDVPNPPTVASQAAQIAAIKNGALDLISYAAIVPLTNCPSVESQGTRYVEMAQALRGKTYDICDLANFGSMLDSALSDLLLPLTSFPLSTRPRDPAQLQVAVNGVPTTGFSYDATTNRIVFARANAPAPGTHITARYQAACK